MKFFLLSEVDPTGGDNQEGGARSPTSSPELFLRDSPGDFLSISVRCLLDLPASFCF